MTFPQIIQDVKNRGYFLATESSEIKTQYERLLAIRERDLLGGAISDAKIVRALVELKLAVVSFLERGMKEEDLKVLLSVIGASRANYQAAMIALNPDYNGSDEKFFAIENAVKKLAAAADGIRKDFGALVSDGYFKGKLDDFSALLKKYEKIEAEPLKPLFIEAEGGKFVFPSVNRRLGKIFEEELDRVMAAMFAGFSLGGDLLIDTLREYDSLQIVPNRSLAKRGEDAPVLFVCTPVREEFDILLNANLGRDGIKTIVQLDLARIYSLPSVKVQDGMARFLLYVLKEKSPNLIAYYGLEKLTDAERKTIYASFLSALRLFPSDVRFVLWDISGNMEGLTEYNRMRRETELLSAENYYLRFPSLEDVKSVFVGSKSDWLTDKRLETIRTECVFAGYRGLNLFFSKTEELGLAVESAKSISAANKSASLLFLERLSDATKLIPLDWQYQAAVEKKAEKGEDEYNYDEIRDVSDERTRAIIANSKFTIYEKCGELVRYLLLADEDKSIWMGNLTEEDRDQRIAHAVRIIAYTMRVYYSDPKVTIVESRKGQWGGLCCNGGSEIKFKRHCVEGEGGIEWTMDAILHELYHSLQHTLTDTDVDPTWYKRNYHISEERIASWYSNSRGYVDIDKNRTIYEVQTMETDARDFAGLCLGDQVYHSHTHEKKKR